MSFSLGRSPFPFLSLTTRSLAVATAVASDTVSNGSGGHTILRLNSTDTAAQQRLFSSYSFLRSLSLPPPPLSYSLSLSSASLSDHTPCSFSLNSSSNPHNNTFVRTRRFSMRVRDLTMENVDCTRPLIFYGNVERRWSLKRE